MPGHIPTRNNQQPERDRRRDLREVAPESRVPKNENKQRDREDSGGRGNRSPCLHAGNTRDQLAEALRFHAHRGEVDRHRVKPRHTPHGRKPFHGRVAGNRNEHNHNQRAQATRAESQKVLVDAT